MVRDALRFLATPVRGFQSAVYVLAAAAVASSLLALFRDRLFAHSFGAGMELDVYYAAFRIPDLIFVGIGALVSVYVLIPELARRNDLEQKHYIDIVSVGFSALAIIASIVAYLAAPRLLALIFTELATGPLFADLITLTRIMLIQPILLGFSNILAAVTQSRHRYTLYALSPLVYNLGIIIGIILFYPFLGLAGLAWGVVLGALLHAGIQVPSLMQDGFFSASPRFDMTAFLRTISISVPRALALSVNQITFIGLTVLAGTLATGSIAVFILAFNLQAVPLAIIGASYSVAAFPSLSAAYAAGRRDEFLEQVAAAARHVLFWSIPAAALIIVLRAHMVRTVLGSGAFDWTDTRLTAAALALFSLSLGAQGIMLLLIRGYYAAGRTLVPLIISIGVGLATLLFAMLSLRFFADQSMLYLLQTFLRLEDVQGSLVVVLALSYSLAVTLGVYALVIHFEFRFGRFVSKIRRTLWQSSVAACAAALASYGALVLLGPLTLASTLASVFLKGLAGGLLGVVAAAFVYFILRNQEFFENFETVRRKLWREVKDEEAPIVVSSAEDVGQTTSQ